MNKTMIMHHGGYTQATRFNAAARLGSAAWLGSAG
jgi:hypothetical protein